MSISPVVCIALVVLVVVLGIWIWISMGTRPGPGPGPGPGTGSVEGFSDQPAGGAGVIGVMTPFGEVRTSCAYGKNDKCVAFDRYVPGNLVVGENAFVSGDVFIKGSLAEVVDANVTGNIRARGDVAFGSSSVGGPLHVKGDMDISHDFVMNSATFTNGVNAGSLDVGGTGTGAGAGAGLSVGAGMSVDRGLNVGGGVSADGAGWFQLGVDSGGSLLAGAGVLAGRNLVATGGVHAYGDVITGKGLYAASCEVIGGPCAVGTDMMAGSLSLDGDVNVSRDVKVGAALTSIGDVAVNGHDGLVTTFGGVSVGGEHDTAGRGVTVLRAQSGGVTSFPVSGPSLVDGNLLIDGKICAGEACLSADDTNMINTYPAIFDGTLTDATTAFNDAFNTTSGKADSGFADAATRMDALLTRIDNGKGALAALVSEDKKIGAFIQAVRDRQIDHDRSFLRINKHDTIQEAWIKNLEGRLDALERSTLSVMRESALEVKDAINECNGCDGSTSAPVADSSIIPAKFMMKSKKNGLCVDTYGTVDMWTCDRSNKVQHLSYDRGTKLLRVAGTNSCMDDGGGKTKGFHLIPCDPNNINQQFEYKNKQFLAVNKNGQCMDDGGGMNRGQTAIHLWACDPNNPSQQFELEAVN